MNWMKTLGLIAVLFTAACGPGAVEQASDQTADVSTPVPEEMGTSEGALGYRSATCYVSDGTYSPVKFNVTSWLNSNGTRTWHWAGQSVTYSGSGFTVKWVFRDATYGRTGTTYAGSSGYYTNAYTGYVTWTGRWWRYLGTSRYEYRCSVSV